MGPRTRSATKNGNGEVSEKKLATPPKKKSQPKKPVAKKANKVEGNEDERELTTISNENANDEPSDEAPEKSGTKRKIQPKKTTSKKTKLSNDKNIEEESPSEAETIYEFEVKDIEGNEVSLDKYKGHVCIIVNVASRCGHTKSNYEQFVELYDKYSDSNGLKILAFPCNQFGSQESGTCEKIKAFVENKGVKFDMFDKINVNGKNASPLWQFLKDKLPEVTSGKATGKDIKWNFTKFIVNKDGVPVERYPSSTKPLTLVESLEKLW